MAKSSLKREMNYIRILHVLVLKRKKLQFVLNFHCFELALI